MNGRLMVLLGVLLCVVAVGCDSDEKPGGQLDPGCEQCLDLNCTPWTLCKQIPGCTDGARAHCDCFCRYGYSDAYDDCMGKHSHLFDQFEDLYEGMEGCLEGPCAAACPNQGCLCGPAGPGPGPGPGDQCDACVESRCAAELGACDANPACAAILDCLEGCPFGASFDACLSGCMAANPTGAALFSALGDCVERECDAECDYDEDGPIGPGPGPSPPAAGCLACISTHCNTESDACESRPACVAARDCWMACPDDDSFDACLNACLAANPMGAAQLNALIACVERHCDAECSEDDDPVGPGPGPGPDPGSDACVTCVEGQCAAQNTACQANPDCSAARDCLTHCGDQEFEDCLSGCLAAHPGGATDLNAFLACAAINCADECFGDDDDPVGPGPDPGPDPCESCITTNCHAPFSACEADSACAAALACLMTCGDEDCIDACLHGYDDSDGLLEDFGECVENSCAAECIGGDEIQSIQFQGETLYVHPEDSFDGNNIQWGGAGATGADSHSDGATNTATIVAEVGHNAGTPYAAQVCAELTDHGYDDWYLPSKDELDAIYQNRAALGIPHYTLRWFWSSTEEDAGRAWMINFGDGMSQANDKALWGAVRCVRRAGGIPQSAKDTATPFFDPNTGAPMDVPQAVVVVAEASLETVEVISAPFSIFGALQEGFAGDPQSKAPKREVDPEEWNFPEDPPESGTFVATLDVVGDFLTVRINDQDRYTAVVKAGTPIARITGSYSFRETGNDNRGSEHIKVTGRLAVLADWDMSGLPDVEIDATLAKDSVVDCDVDIRDSWDGASDSWDGVFIFSPVSMGIAWQDSEGGARSALLTGKEIRVRDTSHPDRVTVRTILEGTLHIDGASYTFTLDGSGNTGHLEDMTYYITVGDTTYGPFDGDQLADWTPPGN